MVNQIQKRKLFDKLEEMFEVFSYYQCVENKIREAEFKGKVEGILQSMKIVGVIEEKWRMCQNAEYGYNYISSDGRDTLFLLHNKWYNKVKNERLIKQPH